MRFFRLSLCLKKVTFISVRCRSYRTRFFVLRKTKPIQVAHNQVACSKISIKFQRVFCISYLKYRSRCSPGVIRIMIIVTVRLLAVVDAVRKSRDVGGFLCAASRSGWERETTLERLKLFFNHLRKPLSQTTPVNHPRKTAFAKAPPISCNDALANV